MFCILFIRRIFTLSVAISLVSFTISVCPNIAQAASGDEAFGLNRLQVGMTIEEARDVIARMGFIQNSSEQPYYFKIPGKSTAEAQLILGINYLYPKPDNIVIGISTTTNSNAAKIQYLAWLRDQIFRYGPAIDETTYKGYTTSDFCHSKRVGVRVLLQDFTAALLYYAVPNGIKACSDSIRNNGSLPLLDFDSVIAIAAGSESKEKMPAIASVPKPVLPTEPQLMSQPNSTANAQKNTPVDCALWILPNQKRLNVCGPMERRLGYTPPEPEFKLFYSPSREDIAEAGLYEILLESTIWASIAFLLLIGLRVIANFYQSKSQRAATWARRFKCLAFLVPASICLIYLLHWYWEEFASHRLNSAMAWASYISISFLVVLLILGGVAEFLLRRRPHFERWRRLVKYFVLVPCVIIFVGVTFFTVLPPKFDLIKLQNGVGHNLPETYAIVSRGATDEIESSLTKVCNKLNIEVLPKDFVSFSAAIASDRQFRLVDDGLDVDAQETNFRVSFLKTALISDGNLLLEQSIWIRLYPNQRRIDFDACEN